MPWGQPGAMREAEAHAEDLLRGTVMLPAQLLRACCRSPPPAHLTVVQQICQHWKASSKEPAKLNRNV